MLQIIPKHSIENVTFQFKTFIASVNEGPKSKSWQGGIYIFYFILLYLHFLNYSWLIWTGLSLELFDFECFFLQICFCDVLISLNSEQKAEYSREIIYFFIYAQTSHVKKKAFLYLGKKIYVSLMFYKYIYRTTV